MESHGNERRKTAFRPDAKNVAESEAVLLIGLKGAEPLGLGCGACGYSTCSFLRRKAKTKAELLRPVCAVRLLDMGIAIGSAVKMANLINVDNRIMYSIGVVTRALNMVDWDLVVGVALSAGGNSIYFDR